MENQHRYLKNTAVPSVFTWNSKKASEQSIAREQRCQVRNYKQSLFQEAATTSSVVTEDFVPIGLCYDVEESSDVNEDVETKEIINTTDAKGKSQHIKTTQTPNILRLFTTDLLLEDNMSVSYFTGLESIDKFKFVLSTLIPMANNITYRWSRVVSLSIEDQFLLLLIKLRRNKPDFELGKIFGISKTEISNIIITWINFFSDIWSLIDIWPSRELINFYMPDKFRKYHNSTRVIIDGTEIPIQKPGHPDSQKVTFSTYKHKNTLKFLVGASPGGLFTYCSGAYAGSVSDRQIVERSSLLHLCEKGDSIMADRGFNIQDLFAKKGVGINIPTFLKGKSQIPFLMLKKDQQLSKQRVHIERLIGLTKTYKILCCDLNRNYVPLASKIFFICMMLCNFREGIVNNKIK